LAAKGDEPCCPAERARRAMARVPCGPEMLLSLETEAKIL